MLLRGQVLHDFETILVHIRHTINTNLNQIILVLNTYLFPITNLSKQKRAMRLRMRKPHELNLRRYEAHIIKLNYYIEIVCVCIQKINIW